MDYDIFLSCVILGNRHAVITFIFHNICHSELTNTLKTTLNAIRNPILLLQVTLPCSQVIRKVFHTLYIWDISRVHEVHPLSCQHRFSGWKHYIHDVIHRSTQTLLCCCLFGLPVTHSFNGIQQAARTLWYLTITPCL